jgi:hypothetical protein
MAFALVAVAGASQARLELALAPLVLLGFVPVVVAVIAAVTAIAVFGHDQLLAVD